MSFENLLFASGAAVNSKIVDCKLNEYVSNQIICGRVEKLDDLYTLEQAHAINFHLPVKCLRRFWWILCSSEILFAILFQQRQWSFDFKFWEQL